MKLSIFNKIKKIIINRTFNTQTKVLSCCYWWRGLMINGECVVAASSFLSGLSSFPQKIISLGVDHFLSARSFFVWQPHIVWNILFLFFSAFRHMESAYVWFILETFSKMLPCTLFGK